MGWSFRRSAKLGPLRLNFSKSGVGWSVGGKGFRYGKDSKGRTYSQTSIPGTGIYSRDYYNGANSPSRLRGVPMATIAIGIAILLAFTLFHC